MRFANKVTNFLCKVCAMGIYDTPKYRYIASRDVYGYRITRLPIDALDTTRAIDGWEYVTHIKYKEV